MPEDGTLEADVIWEVVGGADRGGIIVRKDREFDSEPELLRLSTGARLAQKGLAGDRLHFRKLSGSGPEEGWVSIRLPSGKDLVVRAGEGRPVVRSGRSLPPGRKLVLVLGSSVASGSAAPLGMGWAALLARALQPHGLELDNQAISGTTVNAWQSILEDGYFLPFFKRAGIVIMSLSLANEGLAGTWGQSDMDEIEDHYTNGLRKLMRDIRSCCDARLVLGGPYPNDEYDETHLERLNRVLAAMRTWEEVDHVIDFLKGEVHDGAGKWNEGLASDPAHPNGRGHEAMFSCVDIKGVLGM